MVLLPFVKERLPVCDDDVVGSDWVGFEPRAFDVVFANDLGAESTIVVTSGLGSVKTSF